jgi:glucuronoarabinoxylan endo-1,4-beta-xylanase
MNTTSTQNTNGHANFSKSCLKNQSQHLGYMRNIKFVALLLCLGFATHGPLQAQTATVRLNSSVTFQKITGFGGFVNSPQFAYNHMSVDEIKKLWGTNSEAGYNIMRLYIPIGEANWSQVLETAKLAKSLGLIIFASPWSMPAEWKTNNNIAAVYTDNNGVEQVGSLKDEYYDDYANYLNNFVVYLRNNGVELDAISIQNEPDMKATYAGCIWTPAQMATFIKNYSNLITCKVIAAEGVGISDNYANALLDPDVVDKFGIFAGHQYAGIQTAHKQFLAKGKDVWMTEYLINWNEIENTTRNFSWSKDAFTFAEKLNTAMLANVSAWIHYASKRYYGMMGDGTNGTTTGEITKRGYILSHFAKYAIGTTRIENTWVDDSNVLSGSSYLSLTGDSVVIMVINPSDKTYSLTADLPFYSLSGKSITTTALLNMTVASIGFTGETCRPKVSISPSSFTTLIFKKSSVRLASQMTGSALHNNKIEDQTVTNAAFGTTYQLSGKTATFDHSNSLISSNTTNGNGYIQLKDNFNKLVFHIENITSAMSFTSSNTTLYYVNSSGNVNSHNYGTVNFTQNGSSDWILDISRNVLTDGCSGVLGISNGNYSSILTIRFGDVYFKMGNEKMYKFSGVYSKGDSYLLDCIEDQNYTSLDFTETTGITSEEDWNASAANKNCIYYVSSNAGNNNANVIAGTSCNKLTLADTGGDFYAPTAFIATSASYTRTFSGYGVMVLPFSASIPAGAKAYTMLTSSTEVNCTLITNNIIPANTPVMIVGSGTFKFEGSGDVSSPQALKVNDMYGVYISVKAPAGSYSLKTVGGVTAFYKVVAGQEPTIASFSAYLMTATALSASSLPLRFNDVTSIEDINKKGEDSRNNIYYDFNGRRIDQPKKGYIYILKGKKVVY